MFFPIPNDFFTTLHDKYEEALKSGIIKFNGESAEDEMTKVKLEKDGKPLEIDLHYRTIYSLMHRPEKNEFKKNPFEDPEPELTIVEDFGDANQFRIVYNKYPVVPRHFMILTKQFKSQKTPLSPDELIASYSVLKKLKEDKDNKWFGFYNCNDESGASQPHKHMQFMTLPKDFTPFPETLISTSDAFIPSTKSEPLQYPQLPMAHFVAKLPKLEELSGEDLVMYFSSLLQRCLTVSRDNNASSIAYNVIMTTEYIMMVPRKHGVYEGLGINSCGILGLFLFKNKQLLQMVKAHTPMKVWEYVGFPNTSGQGSDEYHY